MALGELADLARRLRGGDDRVYFVQNLYLNQTNVCRVKCKFCAFAVTRKQADAYTYTAAELVEDAVRQHELTGFTEIHMVGGESPHVEFDYYVDIVRSLHEALPRSSRIGCAAWSRRARSIPTSGSTRTTLLTGSESRRTAPCCTATSRRTRSASITCCASASSRTGPAAFLRSSRSRSIPRTPSSSGAAGGTRPARTT